MLSKALWVGLERHVVVPSGFSKEINCMKTYSYDSKYIGEKNVGKRQVHATPHNMDDYKMDETTVCSLSLDTLMGPSCAVLGTDRPLAGRQHGRKSRSHLPLTVIW